MSQISKRGPSNAALGVGAVVLMVLCCAGPLLLAGGALAVAGGALSSPWVLLAGVLLVGAGAVAVLRRTVGHGRSDSCCAPGDGPTVQSGDADARATPHEHSRGPRRSDGTD